MLVGGYVYPRTGVALGPYANEMLARLNVRRTILSVPGINERGFFNSNLLLVETERAMMHAADEVIVVADSTKFGRQSLAHLCALEDDAPPGGRSTRFAEAWRSKVTDAGVELHIAATTRDYLDEQPATNRDHDHAHRHLDRATVEQIVREDRARAP